MIWTLRNISAHLWITILVTLPVCFYILPILIRFFPQINPMVVGIVMIGLVVITISFLMDIAVKKILAGLIKEGQAWERSGIVNKAEKRYVRAVRLFDSFLLWPFTAKKTAQNIAGVIARFQLNTGSENENFKLATCVYLKMNPQDKDISRLWLQHLRRSSIVTSLEQEVLSLLADAHEKDTQLSPLVADIFLGLERRDFTAQKLYSRIQKEPSLGEKYSSKIEDLVGLPEDEIFREDILFSTPKTKSNIPILKISILNRSGVGLKKVWNSLRTCLKLGDKIKSLAKALLSFVKWSYQFAGSSISLLVLSIIKMVEYVKLHKRVRFYLKTATLTIVSAWLLFFMAGTVSHLFKSKTIKKEKQSVIEQIPKPFTIQVAAYLKQAHADRYVDILKQKGIQASVKKVGGGGKNWFVVRVSEFEDKKSAAAYGQKLKQQKIIDDFFVNNK